MQRLRRHFGSDDAQQVPILTNTQRPHPAVQNIVLVPIINLGTMEGMRVPALRDLGELNSYFANSNCKEDPVLSSERCPDV